MDGLLNPQGFSFGNEMLFLYGRIPVKVKSINSKGKYIKEFLCSMIFLLPSREKIVLYTGTEMFPFLWSCVDLNKAATKRNRGS